MSIDGLINLRTRLNYIGGASVSRLNRGKLWSLRSAFKDSYQYAKIQNLSDNNFYDSLINPDKLKPDYDNKIISTEFAAGLEAGDVFLWVANNTHWMIYLQELTETAYFRAYIRRCRYSVKVNDTDYYVYLRGPEETDQRWNQKAGVVWNDMNHSLVMYIKNNEETREFFKRFNKIKINGQNWEVAATDVLSVGGIIEVNLTEDFNNSLEDLQSVPEIAPIDITVPHIDGPVTLKPFDTATYEIKLAADGIWSLSNDKAKIINSTSTFIEIEVVTSKSGTFSILYSREGQPDIILPIIIESLF